MSKSKIKALKESQYKLARNITRVRNWDTKYKLIKLISNAQAKINRY